MSRRALIAAAVVASAGIATATALPSLAEARSTGTTSTTATVSRVRSGPRVEAVFPAAGQLIGSSVVVRVAPSSQARVIKVMHYFRPDYRVQEILAVGKEAAPDGTFWYRISVPMRPNGTYGWIPATSVSLSPTTSEIVIDVSARTIDVYRYRKHAWHGRVAVGAPGRETPLGHYYVAARFVPYHDPFLGVFALETSAYSKLTEWPGGGVVGIHGTNLPQLLGKAVSHGCVRVSNQTAAALERLAPLGTPIWIRG